MALLEVNPRYRELLAGLGLTRPSDFLALPGVVYCGHPDRHVARVELGALGAFLKREHRVRWKERLSNAWCGFGFVSLARRECRFLQEVAAAGIGCPEPVASGEDGHGRAFLLVREVSGRELRTFLKRASGRLRRRVAVGLGKALARLHAAGFDHPDLYSKHVFVSQGTDEGFRFHFLDWQRSRRRRQVNWAIRHRDLATLDATLAEELASARDRLACLRAYLRGAGPARLPRLARAAHAIRSRARRLLARRRIQELRQPPLVWGRQNLIWVRGEALCVTREFGAELRGSLPDWLALPDPESESCGEATGTLVERSGGRTALLICRSDSRPLAWLRARLRGRRLLSPELEQAGLLFRLQRYGIVTPRLLAVGQRHLRPWRTQSLLLLEPLRATEPLAAWLASQRDAETRRVVLRRAAEVLRRIHDAGCSWSAGGAPALALHVRTGATFEVVLGSVEGLRKGCPRGGSTRDLAALWAGLGGYCRRPELLWFLLGYLDLPRLTAPARRLARRLLPLVWASAPEPAAETSRPAPPTPGTPEPLARGDEAPAGRTGG
jgi:tRNA A-37 threonylcarbamoyl transferase component Bud32